MASVDKAYDLYFQILTLPVELTRYAEQRQELAKQKKLPTYEDLNPNTKFVDNQVIRVIANSDAVNDHIAARKLGWGRHPELIRTLYTQLSGKRLFQGLHAARGAPVRRRPQAARRFLQGAAELRGTGNRAGRDVDPLGDDLPHIVMMILRSLSGLKPSHTELKVPSKFKSDEDPEFVKTLFEKSLVNYDAYQDYIEKFTANWDVERIVFMDNLIIGTAMAELTSFPSIPVKVTLDEYIEISKYYSTPGSSTFINGVLDKIVESLTAEGRIKKSRPRPYRVTPFRCSAGCPCSSLTVTTAACGTRQARTGETGRKGRIIAVTDTILDRGGTDTVRFGRMHSGEIAVLRLWIENGAKPSGGHHLLPTAAAGARRSDMMHSPLRRAMRSRCRSPSMRGANGAGSSRRWTSHSPAGRNP